VRETVIVSAARTPFGRLGGELASFSATDLGGIAINAAVQRAIVPMQIIDNVSMGMVLQGGAGQIPSRQATRKAGLPWDVPSETVNKVCASGLRTVTLADQQIRSGDAQVVVAGGMESMSNAPYLISKARWGYRMGHDQLMDLMLHDGLWCAFNDRHMAVHGSVAANEFKIDRHAQDEWALRSHQLAIAAMDAGKFNDEIVPVSLPQQKGEPKLISVDEGPRRDTTLEKLAKLPPVFTKDGTVTAGNAPGVNDGAGAVVCMSKAKALELGLHPLATMVDHAEVAVEAPYIATAPGLAINKLLAKSNLKISDIKLFEINEAFAAVILISEKIAGWDRNRVNVNGGAIALGHPIGASGTRILMNLIYELRRRGGGYGIAGICSGAAQGDAVLVKVE